MHAAAFIQSLYPHFSPQQQVLIDQHMSHLKKSTWDKGYYFSSEHQPVKHAVLIVHGLVRSFYIQEDCEVNLRFLCDGSLATPFASIAQSWIDPIQPVLANESLQCVSQVVGYLLPIEYLIHRQEYPEFECLRSEIAARHYLSMEQRLRMIQQTRAIDRYRNFLAWMPQAIINAMPSYHVASYLGISPEALSRVKQQLKNTASLI